MLSSILIGILLGGIICGLNIKWLKFYINGVLLNMQNTKRVKVLTYLTFIFRYIIIGGILYLAVKSGVVSLISLIIGFTAVLFLSIAFILIRNKKEIGLNGRTSSLY